MNNFSIFTVTPDQLGRLDARQAVDFVADLLWAETMRVGMSPVTVNISTRINVSDGGIDANIRPTNTVTLSDSFLPAGQSGFQIKAGHSFTPTEAALRKELFGDAAVAPANLGESVRACLDADGTYILVCTGADPTEPVRNSAKSYLRRAFNVCGYPNAQVEVWGQNHLIGLLKRFPSLALAVNGAGGSIFQTHKSWSAQQEMRRHFKAGDPQHAFITSLQDELRRADVGVHVRVRGEAGIGKTRLILEATRAEDLQPLVIYCDSPEKFLEGALFAELLRDDNAFEVIVVVDECDLQSRTTIWNQLGARGRRIRLISVYNDIDEPSGTTVLLDAPPLADAETSAVIQEYDVPKDQADRWAYYCDGSPRVAHVIGQNLRSNPDNILKAPDTVDIWERYVAGSDDLQSTAVQQRRTVLRFLALFKRFGYGAPITDEAKTIWALVHDTDSTISWGRFQEIIKVLRERKILQGQTTLYITPKLLHIKLWSEWFECYGVGFDVALLEARLTPTLVEWFREMYRYAKESAEAMHVVRKMLDESGPFRNADFFRDRRGAQFFLYLTDAAPDAALRRLEQTLGTWSVDEFRQFTDGRREVVWALEKIAVWGNLFDGAARLLLRLAEAENESFANNATGVFAGLFSPGYGAVAPTEAAPDERFAVLRDALLSASKEQRSVALRAADHALETDHFSRMGGAEHQGLRRPPRLWVPKTWGELFDTYRRVWQLLDEQREVLAGEERAEVVRILLRHAGGVGAIANLSSMVTQTLSRLLQAAYVDRRDVIEALEGVYRYRMPKMAPEARTPWDALRAELAPSDLHARLERYVGMDRWADTIDADGKRTDVLERIVGKLAEEAYRDPAALQRDLPWLVTDEAKNGFAFGYALGSLDTSTTLLPDLLAAQAAASTKPSAFFLGGYLRALFERDAAAGESILDDLAANPQLRQLVPELSWRSTLSDRGGRRILALARAGAIEPTSFRMFSFGGVIRNLSDAVFHSWIEFLLEQRSSITAGIAVDLFYFYYVMSDDPPPLPRDLTLALVTADPFFGGSESTNSDVLEEHSWVGVAQALLHQHPEGAVVLGENLLAHFADKASVMGRFHSSAASILEEVLRARPDEFGPKVLAEIRSPFDARAFRLTQWLRDGALSAIPPRCVWAWIDVDVEKRAPYVAGFVAPTFPGEPGTVSARELLIRYGDRADVRQGIIANFFTEVWWGHASSHYQTKLAELASMRANETNPNILRWLDEYGQALRGNIEHAKVQEEREDS